MSDYLPSKGFGDFYKEVTNINYKGEEISNQIFAKLYFEHMKRRTDCLPDGENRRFVINQATRIRKIPKGIYEILIQNGGLGLWGIDEGVHMGTRKILEALFLKGHEEALRLGLGRDNDFEGLPLFSSVEKS